MDGMRRMLSYVRRAVDDYDMIEEGDRIAVGLSAGKDSLALLMTLAELRRFYPKKFDLCAITIDMGREGVDYSPIQMLCREIDVPYHIQPSQIADVIFNIRKESNPCSLCAKMRRGLLNKTAADMGYHKIALGHHFDDAVETFMLNLYFEGRIGSFSPVTYLSRTDVTVIRPMIYAPEKYIRYLARKNEFPVVDSRCPANGYTEREKMKEMLRDLEKTNKGVKHRIFNAMQKAGIDGYKETKLRHYPDPEQVLPDEDA